MVTTADGQVWMLITHACFAADIDPWLAVELMGDKGLEMIEFFEAALDDVVAELPFVSREGFLKLLEIAVRLGIAGKKRPFPDQVSE